MNKKIRIYLLTAISILCYSCKNAPENTLNNIDLIPGESGSYYTLDGKRVIHGKDFLWVDFFSDGLARVQLKKDNKVGYINKEGEIVIDAGKCSGYYGQYATGFWNGVAFKIPAEGEENAGKLVAFDTKGKTLFVLDAEPVTMFNKEGKAIVATGFDEEMNLCYATVDKSGNLTPINSENAHKRFYIEADQNNYLIHSDRIVFGSADGQGIIDMKGKNVGFPTPSQSYLKFDKSGNILQRTKLEDEQKPNSYSSTLYNDNDEILDILTNEHEFITFDGDRYLYKYDNCYEYCDENGHPNQTIQEADIPLKNTYFLFHGAKYAFISAITPRKYVTYRLDREGNIKVFKDYSIITPLLGGKVYAAQDKDKHLILCNIEGIPLENIEQQDIYMESNTIFEERNTYDLPDYFSQMTSYGKPCIFIWWDHEGGTGL